jgi:uncharacterized protein (UPF0332 family)
VGPSKEASNHLLTGALKGANGSDRVVLVASAVNPPILRRRDRRRAQFAPAENALIITSVSPKSKANLARDHLEVARDDLDGARMGDALNALFYASEAAVVALAEANGIDTKKNHRLKASAAKELHDKGVLDEDFSSLLRDLNQGRKDHWYEGEEPDLDLEEVYIDVEILVDSAQGEGK